MRLTHRTSIRSHKGPEDEVRETWPFLSLVLTPLSHVSAPLLSLHTLLR